MVEKNIAEFIILAGSSLFFCITGLIVWVFADIPLILREIALNTRDKDQIINAPAYGGVTVLCGIIKAIAVLLWILAIVVPVFTSAIGSQPDWLLDLVGD